MVKIERGGVPIRNREDVAYIDDQTVQQLTLYFLDIHPGKFDIEYEPHEFICSDSDGKSRGAKPDLFLRHRATGIRFYAEATLAYRSDVKTKGGVKRAGSAKGVGNDFKARQREVMEIEGEKCVFYYREQLMRIQQRYSPRYDSSLL